MKMPEVFNHQQLFDDLVAQGKLKDENDLSEDANAAVNDFNDEYDKAVAPYSYKMDEQGNPLKDEQGNILAADKDADGNFIIPADAEFDEDVIYKLNRFDAVAVNEIMESVKDDYVAPEPEVAAQAQAAQAQAQADARAAQAQADADAQAAQAQADADAQAAQAQADADARAAQAQSQAAPAAPAAPAPEKKVMFGWF